MQFLKWVWEVLLFPDSLSCSVCVAFLQLCICRQTILESIKSVSISNFTHIHVINYPYYVWIWLFYSKQRHSK